MKIIQSVNVSATLKAMDVNTSIFLDSSVNENTLRNACVRLKVSTGRAWSVDKLGKIGYKVTRTV